MGADSSQLFPGYSLSSYVNMNRHRRNAGSHVSRRATSQRRRSLSLTPSITRRNVERTSGSLRRSARIASRNRQPEVELEERVLEEQDLSAQQALIHLEEEPLVRRTRSRVRAFHANAESIRERLENARFRAQGARTRADAVRMRADARHGITPSRPFIPSERFSAMLPTFEYRPVTVSFDFGTRIHSSSIESNASSDSVDVIVYDNNRASHLRDHTNRLHDSVMHIVFSVGMFLNNRYSSDSEDSFMPPRIIDPNEISEDESDEEVSNIVELPAPEPSPTPVVASISSRAVTRSMSRNPEFYNQPGSSRRTIPYFSHTKNAVGVDSKDKTEIKVPGTKTVIKVDKMNPCTICCEEAPKRPVACTYCRQTIGCRHCVKKWFFTTNMSHLDQRTPYPIGSTDRNHKRCPLCRADWGDTMRIVAAIERDAFPALIQATNPPMDTAAENSKSILQCWKMTINIFIQGSSIVQRLIITVNFTDFVAFHKHSARKE
uniref:RING-type domain-containing protein n=1 Tax=Panagrolaimus sp. JU765 TaxID=591449 RepID=A0AC34R8G6_9BILA